MPAQPAAGPGQQPVPAPRPGGEGHTQVRPGPMPPRMEPMQHGPTGVAGAPTPAGPGYLPGATAPAPAGWPGGQATAPQHQGVASVAQPLTPAGAAQPLTPAVAAQPLTPVLPAQPGLPLQPAAPAVPALPQTAAVPSAPVLPQSAPPAGAGQHVPSGLPGQAGVPGQPVPLAPGQHVPPGNIGPGPLTGLGQAAGPGVPVPPAGLPATGGRRPGWAAVTALVLAFVLLVVAGVQAYQIVRLSDRLAKTDQKLAEAQSDDGARLDGLEKRTDALEKQAGSVFNPEAIAAAVLPSVFRVRAGNATGTAFAVGKPNASGGANLFTNFHVVDSVWESGQRQVFLERTDQRFPATIVDVDKENDVALLKTDSSFNGLVTAPAPVKSGQQIVVVGAPLGLEDSVTSGVVSAFRKSPDGSGTMIQFDAPINPGNSGGPVINGAKEVVGIATAKARDAEGIGLAVPIKTACDKFKIC
ncbi:S1C family serine protease [Micromonospora sonneratiae]|uniref:Trypsin-like peptidase domain-containing protein n=1 Tax=Micromonospora sonneratiae TaxID=1184706 RepID=A0ABW3YIZ7_9ACTN